MAYIKCLRNVISIIVPDGKTVTPTDDVSIWLQCGQRSENYTTLAEVLADSTCLSALMADNNAVDYLVRSTTFASGITADSTAMSYIGANDYASETLMADATWCAAIIDSAYADYVSNVKVPAMTSNTTPSGECNATSEASATYAAWKAFDGNSSSMWSGGGHSSFYLRYTFTKPIKVYCAKHIWFYSTAPSISYKIQGLNSGVVEYESENKTSLVISPNENTVYISNPSACESWQIYVSSIAYGSYTDGGRINKLQFYGRENGGVQTWLHLAGITNKTYTTLSEVFADSATLSTLMANHDAVDYLVTCKGWATEVCSNQSAMSYIGLNNYCANTLLANADWNKAIQNSQYFESVDNN